MNLRVNRGLLFSGALLLSGALLHAGEQVQFRGSTSIELPKPKRPLDDPRRMRSEPERPNLEGGFVAPPSSGNPLNNKKLREEMDKKRNWIFANPYKQQFDNKTEEFMRAEKGTGLYDNKWMDGKEEKNAVQKFISEKDSKSNKEMTRNGEREKLADRDPDRDNLENGRDEPGKTKSDDLFGTDPKSSFGKVDIFGKPPEGESFRTGTLDKTFERNPVTENPFVTRQNAANAIEKEDLKQQQIAHEREFDQILQNKLGSASASSSAGSIGRLDSLNISGGSSIGTLDLKADGSRPGTGGGNRFGGGGGTSVSFSDGGPSLGSRPSFDKGSFEAPIGNIGRPPSSFAPSVAPQLDNNRQSFTPAPFSLPFPQRKF